MPDKQKVLHYASRFQSLLVLVLMIVAMSLLSDRFMTTANGWNILRQISVNVCLAIGMTMVIVSGGIDLSVGSVLAFSGAITAGLIKNPHPNSLVWRRASVHCLGSDRSWTECRHVSWVVQWPDDHQVEDSTIRCNVRDAQHCTGSYDALDQGISNYRLRR